MNLSGNGTNPLTISPSGLSFSAQTVGTVSAAKIFTLTNHEVQRRLSRSTPAGDYTANSNCTDGFDRGQLLLHDFCQFHTQFCYCPAQRGRAR